MKANPDIPRRVFLKAVGATMLLAGCGGSGGAPAASPAQSTGAGAATPAPAQKAPSGSPQSASGSVPGWDELVKAARQEGQVVLAAVNGDVYRSALADAFEKAYPDVKVQATYAPVFDQIPRVLAERQAGKYLTDIFINGTGPSLVSLKPVGALAPLKPALMLPEVLDTSAWFQGRLWWADAAEPLTTVSFEGSVNSPMAYNTKMVDPAQFTSYFDFLKPEWKGKLCATDLRQPGPGAVNARVIYRDSQLGPAYLERLFREASPTVSSDQRQLIDWVAQGRFPAGLFLSFTQVGFAAAQGVPISMVPGEQFKEGTPIGPGPGAVNLMERAPHPNAAKLYVNWLLSKEGQLAWQTLTRENSLRVDLPKENLLPFTVPKAGANYLDGSTEEYARVSAGQVAEAVNKGLGQGS